MISARLITGDSGNVLVALRETADDAAAIVSAIDRLSKKLRERAGESHTRRPCWSRTAAPKASTT
ncbi:MAG: hypothetical protein ACRENP_15800 [Longimicrobiales bacterium]